MTKPPRIAQVAQVAQTACTLVLALAVTLVVSGCFGTKTQRWTETPAAWTKAGVDDTQRRDDHRRCLREANRLNQDSYLTHRETRDEYRAGGGGGSDSLSARLDHYEAERERNHAYGACMRRLGYIPGYQAQSPSTAKPEEQKTP